MIHAKISRIVMPAAVFAALILSVVPAHAQRRGVPGRGGFGVSRGPSRAMGVSRAFAAPRGVAFRQFGAVAPFGGGRYALRPPVRLGYGLSVGYPVGVAYPYAYPYPAPYAAYAPYPVAVAAPVYRAPITVGVPVPLSLAIAGRIVRGAGRLALHLLIP
jgi:hypothetical protein